MNKLLALLLAALPAYAAEQASASNPPQKIEVKGLPQTQMIDDVVVPAPNEVFTVLDKISRPHWGEVLRKSKGVVAPMPDREHTALLLGTIIAEGFIAVEAEAAEEVKKIGRSVLTLSRTIGVRNAAVKRSTAIIEAADKKDWVMARRELDKAQNDVKTAMVELNDMALSQLVSLGGWVRGTEALTQVVKKEYSKDGAELLHQPALADYFDRRIKEMKPEKRNQPVVQEVQKGLAEIRPLMGVGGEISSKTVEQAGEIASRVVKAIQSKSN